jgi:hypothetical protein
LATIEPEDVLKDIAADLDDKLRKRLPKIDFKGVETDAGNPVSEDAVFEHIASECGKLRAASLMAATLGGTASSDPQIASLEKMAREGVDVRGGACQRVNKDGPPSCTKACRERRQQSLAKLGRGSS